MLPTCNWDIAVSQSTVSRCVRAVTNAINNLLLRRWVRFPMTDIKRFIAKEKFRTAPHSFPNTIGAIDCTHINIIAPRRHEEAYVNHWGNHTLNVQAVSIVFITENVFIIYAMFL